MGYVSTEPVLRRRATETSNLGLIETDYSKVPTPKELTWRFFIGVHVMFGVTAFTLGALILATA